MNNKKETHKKKKPWPTKKAMEQVYKMKLWGDNNTDFYSGEGSYNLAIVNPYLDVVKLFLNSFEKRLVVCDLGCGDFNVGKELVQFSKKYFAIDIVEDLIKRNKEKFKAENLEFRCLDISKDNLPSGDCVLLRQVLQHLSNTEISKILTKLSNFKYIILTEHLPNGNFTPNEDIISGQGIRLKKQSGLNLLKPPFNFKVKGEKQLLATNLKESKGVILTTLYQLF
ncbi:class I SAM-dependent methyltransferase [Polaribacter cellanae]|uniref:Class I SAM-dependent methyltransferase n=1 Tax=Polaribacter cellanae TaxID=2818493 RepID=A0A975HA01_9FLAO|nr:class I SAM-dependent methyltransferase [Polaribacter cellanae]QTE23655.1 class I SAM-dependent methyltransferase [Polaribacter cellanae]